MKDPVQQAADYIQTETDKFGTTISSDICLNIAKHLHRLWSGEPEIKHSVNVAQQLRPRYEGEAKSYEGESWD